MSMQLQCGCGWSWFSTLSTVATWPWPSLLLVLWRMVNRFCLCCHNSGDRDTKNHNVVTVMDLDYKIKSMILSVTLCGIGLYSPRSN